MLNLKEGREGGKDTTERKHVKQNSKRVDLNRTYDSYIQFKYSKHSNEKAEMIKLDKS